VTVRIGISGGAATVDRVIEQVQQAEADGFSTVWFPGATMGDPLAAMAAAGRASSTIELGTSILQTFPCHPTLMANRAAAAAVAMGRDGFTLGIGPSHEPAVTGLGYSYERVGLHTEEYVSILTALLRGEAVDFTGDQLSARGRGTAADVPVLVAALGRRNLRVAGEQTAGTIAWMGNERAIAEHVAPRITAAASGAGRAAPRIVVGLPCAVHDDLDEARDACMQQFGFYGDLPNYRRLMDIGQSATPADASIIGDEASVTKQIEGLFDAGATDVWCAPFPAGDDRAASRARTRALLKSLT
jgi:F420-dependent oxidoreductase-like protein